MIIKELRALRGANYYHRKPVITMLLDIEELEERPSDKVPHIRENMESMLPTLKEHTCSLGYEGGFLTRLDRGTWAGHVAEHVALELQNLLGYHVNYGKTITLDEKGMYRVIFRYENEAVGLEAAKMGVEISEAAYNGKTLDITPYLDKLKAIDAKTRLGPSTGAIVAEAKKRGIPHIRLNDGSFVQLGYGKHQRRIEASVTDQTSSIAVELVADKLRCKKLLQEAGVPVPEGRSFNTLEDAKEFVQSIGFPLVVKPLDGHHGEAVTNNIKNYPDLAQAFEQAKECSDEVIIERHLSGFDYRILVIDGKFSAAALREPAHVIGDGTHTIRELVDEVNSDPLRGEGHDNYLTKIELDDVSQNLLKMKGMDEETVLPNGRRVFLKPTANLSTGGTAIDVTDDVHPENKILAERVAALVGLDICGIDLIAHNIDTPLKKEKDGIVEVNAGPGLRMHLHPSFGPSRNVAKDIVDMLFPVEQNHDLPICAVTGTNGKTTTSLLIHAILRQAGHHVGLTTTQGVKIDDQVVLKGDYSGPTGAQTVLKDPTIDCAVLEVARGGIIRRGLGFDTCDVGLFLNVSSDHLGQNGVKTIEELARVKSTVSEAVKPAGFAVYNADNPMCLSRVDKTDGYVVLFSKDYNNPLLQKNLKPHHFNVTVRDGKMIIQNHRAEVSSLDLARIPITYDAKADFNIENVLAATAACLALGLDIAQIEQGLLSFKPSYEQCPGRMNLISINGFNVFIDYGHNVDAARATGEFFRKLKPRRLLRMVSGVGDRSLDETRAYGKMLAKYTDYTIITDPANRDKQKGITAKLIQQSMLAEGADPQSIEIILEEKEAVQRTLSLAKAGDLVVLQADDIDMVMDETLKYKHLFDEVSIA